MLTAREICEIELPDVPPLLGAPDRGPLAQPGWRIIIGAQSGAGKTTVCMRMLKAHVNGEKFLAWRGYGGKALVLDLEQGLRTVQRRLEEAGLDECDAVDYIRQPEGLAIDKRPEQRDWLYGVLTKGQYGMVLIDPLYKLHEGELDERAAVELMRYLDRWREELGFCLLIPAHLRKAEKTGRRVITMDDIAGSGAIIRGAEVVLGFQQVASVPESGAGYGRSILHFWKDRDGDLPTGQKWDLLFRPDEGFTIGTGRTMTTQDKIAAALASVWPQGMTLREIEAQVKLSERTIQRNLNLMEDGAHGEIKFAIGPSGVKVYKLEKVYDPEEEGWIVDDEPE